MGTAETARKQTTIRIHRRTRSPLFSDAMEDTPLGEKSQTINTLLKMKKQTKAEVKNLQAVTWNQHEVNGVPFMLATEANKTMIAFGNSLASALKFECEEEAKKYLQAVPWDVVMTMAITAAQIVNAQK